jgi:uncharacterized membrane protein YuzA (DUF378 family)
MDLYTRKWFELISLGALMIGSIIVGIRGFTGWDPLAKLSNVWVRIVCVLVGVSVLIHMFSRNYYLPFLGDSAYPCGSLALKTPSDANVEVLVNVSPNTNVVYWAAESNNDVQPNPWMAYSSNTNAGVTRSDATGKAMLRVRRPASYKVPTGRTLESHIHYRVCISPGMLGPVETTYLT